MSRWLIDLERVAHVFVIAASVGSAAALLGISSGRMDAPAGPDVPRVRTHVAMQSAPDQIDPRMNRIARAQLGRDLTPQESRAIAYCLRKRPSRGVPRNSAYYAAILDADRNGLACEPHERPQ